MIRNSKARGVVPRVALALACGIALWQRPLLAASVTRSVEPLAVGCKVTLAWEFSGKIESDLIIEERLAAGWSVDDSTVPFASLDASWFSGNVARFAVKPSLLNGSGSISFTVVPSGSVRTGTASGDWKLYLDGKLAKSVVLGQTALSLLAGTSASGGESGLTGTGGTVGATCVETPVAISSFRLVGGTTIELSYAGVKKSGTLVVEGCEGLGKGWTEIKSVAVTAGDGKVELKTSDVRGSRFFRMKLVTEEK